MMYYIFYGLLVFLGYAIGMTWHDFPLLDLKNEVSPTELANIILLIILTGWLPYSIQKIISTSKDLKIMLLNEVQDLFSLLEKTKNVLDQISTHPEDKDKMIKLGQLSNELDYQIQIINNQLENFFKKSTKTQLLISESYFRYDQFLTGGEPIDELFCRKNIAKKAQLKKDILKHSYQIMNR